MRKAAVLAFAVCAVGCRSSEAARNKNAPAAIVADSALRVEGDSFTAKLTDQSFRFSLPYRFENRTGKLVAFPACRRMWQPQLEVLRGERWESAWMQVYLTCRSPEVYVDPGGILVDTAHYAGCYRSGRSCPEWDVDTVNAVFRLKLTGYKLARRVDWAGEIPRSDTLIVYSHPLRISLRR